MNINPLRLIVLAAALLATVSSALAQGTAFTYQGRLNDSAAPATGSYDLTFALFNVVSGAGQVGNTVTNPSPPRLTPSRRATSRDCFRPVN